KYTLAGKANELARAISQMPERWREALKNEGDVALQDADITASSQHLMIPPGMAGNLIKMATEKVLGDRVREAPSPYPEFEVFVLDMGEMVLDIPSVVRALAEPYYDCIRHSGGPHEIEAKIMIYT